MTDWDREKERVRKVKRDRLKEKERVRKKKRDRQKERECEKDSER